MTKKCRQPFWLISIVIALILAGTVPGIGTAYSQENPPEGFSPWLGGCGGLYFYADEGELRVDIAKQDLNIRGIETHLRAVLFGPDRSVIDEQWIADDGKGEGSGPGPIGTVSITALVKHPGVYGLNITVSEDRYGENMSWAFRTNCRRYLIETSRGHKDARHMEPVVLRSKGESGDVAFLPGEGPFSIEVSGLDNSGAPLTLYDSSGARAASLPVSPEGAVQFMGSSKDNGRPWRLHLPDANAVVEIDGVTRWEPGEANENLSLWTTDTASWFPFHENRWLLFPYSKTVYGGSGEKGELTFTVQNNGSAEKRIRLALEFDGAPWQAELEKQELRLGSRESETVAFRYTVPASADRRCRIRATADGDASFSTWSSVTVRAGRAPADSPLTLPLKFEPYRHENAQLGFLPRYPLDNQVYFSPQNRPYIASTDGINYLRDGEWAKTSTAQMGHDGTVIPMRLIITKLAFDGDGGIYSVGRHNGVSLLLYSKDSGVSYSAWPIPGDGNFDIETFTGQNKESGPPPIARYKQTASDPNLIWRRINDLDLFFPVKNTDGSITVGEPVSVSKLCIGLSVHSGIPSTIVSRGDKVHITWGEATDPDKDVPGVPTYVATYDRRVRRLSQPSLVGYGPPANDIHNTPCITMDSKGFLHVLVGTHGRTFKYSKSLVPNTGAEGWTEVTDIGPGLRQTYVGMVCGKDDAVYTAFRLWLDDDKYYPAGYYANLAFMSKRNDVPWTEAKPLVVAPFSEYSIFYHRLTIDRRGRLFLSYDYWSTFWFYRVDHRGTRRSLMMSDDSGNTWRMVTTYTIAE